MNGPKPAPTPAHTEREHPITPRATLAATAVVWPAALTLFTWHLIGGLPLGALGVDLWCAWLLALGCVGFWTTFLRVTTGLLAEDWRVGLALGDLTHLPLGQPALDGVLSDASRPTGYVRAGLWPVFGAIGFLFWGLAAAFTAITATGYLQPHPSDALLGLVVIMIPAVQCTGAAINGPPLSRQYAMRKAAGLAHERLREQRAVGDGAAVLRGLGPDALTRLAHVATGLAAHPEPEREPLHLVNGTQQEHSTR